MNKRLIGLAILAVAIVAVQNQSSAVAQAAVMKFNFGADISGAAGFADHVQGDATYTAVKTFGWTFRQDPSTDPNMSGKTPQFRDRGGDPRNLKTLVLDTRTVPGDMTAGGAGAPLRDPFTFRVDLPNGTYDFTASFGDTSNRLVTTILVGDTFLSSGSTTALDNAAASTIKLVDGVFTDADDPATPAIDGDVFGTSTARFTVTKGYVLIGLRRTEGSIRHAAMNDLVITPVPEPASVGLLGALAGGGLLILRPRRGVSGKAMADTRSLNLVSARKDARGFTLVELLVVIGIIAVLISILMPALTKARESAIKVNCSSNIRQVVLGLQLYANSNKNYLPYDPGRDFHQLPKAVVQYLVGEKGAAKYLPYDAAYGESYGTKIMLCPADQHLASYITPPVVYAERFPYSYYYRQSSTGLRATSGGKAMRLGGWPKDYLRGSRWLIADKHTAGTYFRVGNHPYGNNFTWASYWHKGGTNVGFDDGHVSWVHAGSPFAEN